MIERGSCSAVSVVNRDSPFTERQRFSAALQHAQQIACTHSPILETLDPLSTQAASGGCSAHEAALQATWALPTSELATASGLALTAARSRAAFLALINHAFRTALNRRSGVSALLADTPLTAEQRGYLNALTASSHHPQVVLDKVIDDCRTESGDMVLQPEPFNVRAVIDQACDEAADLALNKGLDFTVDVPGSMRDVAGESRPWVMRGSARRVGKVESPPVLNAILSTNKGGVRVMAR